MIVEFTGLGGNGKSLLVAVIMKEIVDRWAKAGKNLELWIDFPVTYPHKLFHWAELPQNLDDMFAFFGINPGIIVGDEFYVFANSRNWKKNIDMTEFFGQIRKLHKDFYFVNQLTGETDNRIREKAEYRIECEAWPQRPFPPPPSYKPLMFLYKCYKLDWSKKAKKKLWNRSISLKEIEAHGYYQLYQSYDLIAKENRAVVK